MISEKSNLPFKEKLKRHSHSNTFIKEEEWDKYVYSEFESERNKFNPSSFDEEYKWDYEHSKIIEDARKEWKMLKGMGGYQCSKHYIENKKGVKMYNYISINKYKQHINCKLAINYKHIKKSVNKSTNVKIFHKNTNEKIVENLLMCNQVGDKCTVLYKCGIIYDLIEEIIHIYISKDNADFKYILEYDVMESNYLIYKNIEVEKCSNGNIIINIIFNDENPNIFNNYYVVYNKGTNKEERVALDNSSYPFIYNRKVYTVTNKELQYLVKGMFSSYILVDNYDENIKDGINNYKYKTINSTHDGLKLVVDFIHIKDQSIGDSKVLITQKCSNYNIRQILSILRMSDKKIIYDCNILYDKRYNTIKIYDIRGSRSYGYEKVVVYDIFENNHLMYNNVFIYKKDNIHVKITIYDDVNEHEKMKNYFVFNSGVKLEMNRYGNSLYIFNKILKDEELEIVNCKKTFAENNFCLQASPDDGKGFEKSDYLNDDENYEKNKTNIKIDEQETVNTSTDISANTPADVPEKKKHKYTGNDRQFIRNIVNLNKIINFFNNMELEANKLLHKYNKMCLRMKNKGKFILKAPLNANMLKLEYPINKNKFKLKPLLYNKYLC